jgi:hypothetical protein
MMQQVAEEWPSVPRFVGFPLAFPVSSTGKACCSTVGDASMRPLQRIACLREAPPCGAKAGPFLPTC